MRTLDYRAVPIYRVQSVTNAHLFRRINEGVPESCSITKSLKLRSPFRGSIVERVCQIQRVVLR